MYELYSFSIDVDAIFIYDNSIADIEDDVIKFIAFNITLM
jgi:hypothetical protein